MYVIDIIIDIFRIVYCKRIYYAAVYVRVQTNALLLERRPENN